MQIEFLTEADFPLWQDFLEYQINSNLCHDLRWKNVLCQTFAHKSYYLVAKDQGKILACFPLIFVKSLLFGQGLISLPYLNAGGSLSAHRDIESELISKAIDLKQELDADYLELRQRGNLAEEIIKKNNLQTRQHKVTFILKLNPDLEKLFASFSAKLRSQIRRPEKAGASAQIINGAEVSKKQLAEFYQVFAEHMRDLGTPVYPRYFFENTIKEFGSAALLGLVYFEGKVVAGGITIQHKDTAEIIWAASSYKYNKHSVNMLLYWELMKALAQQGITKFDFGRTSKDSGGYNFKKQWGGEEIPLYWYYHASGKYLPDINPRSSKFSPLVKLWQKLPVFLANQLGPILTRHLP